jgi:hypothetical protein
MGTQSTSFQDYLELEKQMLAMSKNDPLLDQILDVIFPYRRRTKYFG